MTRSRHTDPRAIRAKRRVRSPHVARGFGDQRRFRRLRRALKEMGIVLGEAGLHRQACPARVQIRVQNPRPGFLHPVDRVSIRRVLEFIGPEAVYGVRRIELAHSPGVVPSGLPPLGRLVVPGIILLYEQPVPPWHLLGRLSAMETSRLVASGAVVESAAEGTTTTVHWSESALRDFMLFEVLVHEIGHHLLQHHAGKRMARIARTHDHEAFAGQFVRRCRSVWSRYEENL